MIARVAEHCFWFGRYIERTEASARMLAVTLNLALDGELTPQQCWLPPLIVSGEQQRFTELHGGGSDDGDIVQSFLTWEEQNPCSLRRTVGAARDNGRSIRELLSLEAWEALNQLHLWMLQDGGRAAYLDNRDGFYRRIRESTQLCLGLLRSTMLHDTPLDFIWLGVLLERAGQTARMLDVHHHALSAADSTSQLQQAMEDVLWFALLRASSGFEAFMKRYQGRANRQTVAAFLICEPAFPRSIGYCVHSAYDRMCRIRPPGEPALPGAEPLARLRALDEWLGQQTVESGTIHEALTRVVVETAKICDGIGRDLFGVAPSAPAVAKPES
jgi:uncharacterized alpha-E superfamily protein